MKIERDKIKYIQKRRRDDVGEIFEYDGKILRGIYPHAANMVRGLFESGFIQELIEKDLFPKSWITEYKSDDYGLIIEHQKIWPIIYPQEWSFHMLKDSALVVIEVAKIARAYGYNMKDCHGYNVLIENNKPKFIDLGSFHINKEGITGWQPFEEFFRFYYYPLFTWKDGLDFTSKLSIFSANLTPHVEHLIYKYRFLRILSNKHLEQIRKISFLFSYIACYSNQIIDEKIKNKNLFLKSAIKLLKLFTDKTKISISQNLDALQKRIKNITRKELETQWKSYHSNISKKQNRFNHIINFINEYCKDIETAIDIGGNQGLFAEMLLEKTKVQRVIVQDFDEQAIDIGYQKHKVTKYKVSYVHYNIMNPIVTTTRPMPWDRFQCDIVFALALLHHLILTQGFALEDILDMFDKYSKKYVCIEFMPKGLWVHKDGDKVAVPDWYTLNWFKEEFIKRFDLLLETQIEENYIVFIGKKR